MSALTYARSPTVVWRVGPDRVLVRPTGDDGSDLVGVAAMIWIALDQPRTPAALHTELTGIADGPVDVEGTLVSLLADGLIAAVTCREAG